MPVIYLSNIYNGMSILYAISIVYIAGEYCDPPFWTPIGRIEYSNLIVWYGHNNNFVCGIPGILEKCKSAMQNGS